MILVTNGWEPWQNSISQLEYQKGQDNAVADMLRRITTHLGPEAMQVVLDGATIGASQRAEGEDPAVIKGDQQIGEGDTSCCWESPGRNVCHQLGHSSKRRP